MAVHVLIPNAGQTSGEATIVRWLKKPGDSVRPGEVLLEVETDKATMEVEATAAGVLQDVRCGEGERVPILTKVAVIAVPGESPAPPAQAPASAAVEGADILAVMLAHRPGRALASPLARNLAAKSGIELSAVPGSGPHGRIMKRDVEAIGAGLSNTLAGAAPARESPAPGAGPSSRWMPFSATRRTIAERTTASWRDAPQVTLTTEADAESLARLRVQFERDLPEAGDVSFTDLFVKIAATALRQHPQLNAWLDDGGSRQFEAIHIGLAVDAERGLIVPVIRDADRKGVGQIAAERRDLVERARGGKLRPDELTGGTFTLTNLGAFEIDAFTPILNPPQAAVLGVGRIVKKAVVHDDEVRPGMTVALSLTFDHRLVDGGPAARFLQWIKLLVEKPHLLIS